MPSQALSPPSLPQSACLTAPLKNCRVLYYVYFGSAIAFAAKVYWHTVQQLGEMARDPNAGVRRFTKSLLARTWDICLPFCGVLVSRADNPTNWFVFQSLSCSRDCSLGKRCNYWALWVTEKEITQSIKPGIYQSTGSRATIIQNIANNPILAATEIWMLLKEIRCLCSQITKTVLSNKMDKHGSHLPDGVVGEMKACKQLASSMDLSQQHYRTMLLLRGLSYGKCTAITSARWIRMVERVEAGRGWNITLCLWTGPLHV